MAIMNSVLGPIDTSDLGVTLIHEHLLIGWPGWEKDPLVLFDRRAEIDRAVERLQELRALGVQTFVDPCPIDIGRDIDNVTGGNPDGPVELTDDLLVFAEGLEAVNATRALSSTLSGMLVNRTLDEQTRSQLATLLWTTVAARDFSERQIDKLKDDMRELLMSSGVSQQDANLAAGWVGNVQKAVTQRSRRWYERY